MIKLASAVLNYGFKFVSKKNPNDCLISCASLNRILLDHMHLILFPLRFLTAPCIATTSGDVQTDTIDNHS